MTHGITVIGYCLLVIGTAACSDWSDHYESATEGEGNATLWEQLQANPQLSDFCEVLEATRLFRMHRKTEVSYAQLLNSGQSFTVLAPVNGTFNKDSLLRLVQTAPGDSIVEKKFIFNHLSRMTVSMNSSAQTLHLLNGKNVTISESGISGVPLVTANQRALNGVIHVVSHAVPYGFNLYEALCDEADINLIGASLRQYDWDEFDAEASVSSGIVDGVPVYVDSVVYEHNRILGSIGLINAEDSTYWVVAPTNEGWRKAWDATSKFFVFDKSYQKADSLQKYWTNRALLDDAIFNMTDQKSVNDSLVSVPYLNWRRSYVAGKPVFHVFKSPFAAGGILNGAQQIACSNGVLYKTDEWPFTPEETFFKELWTEAETTWLITDYKDCVYSRIGLVADSISQNSYLQIVATSRVNWELTFRLDNVLSGRYDICAIVLPQTVMSPDATKLKPCKFTASVNYVKADGTEEAYHCQDTQFENIPDRVDTIVVAEAFQFPATNYNQSTNKISLTLKCNISTKESSKYSREMLLDCIYLRPRGSEK